MNISEANKKKWKLFIAVFKMILLLCIVIGLPIYIFVYHYDIIASFKSVDQIVAILDRYQWQSVLVYIGLQVLQIVISFIPGQAFQLAAGYIFGFIFALIYALIGAIIGTFITFYLARALGHDFLTLFYSKDKINEYVHKLNSKKAYTIVFLLYLIPGLPKDVISYAAGASSIEFKPFIVLSILGRLPGMIGCLIMGVLLEKKSYIGVIVIAIFAIIGFIICIIYRKKIEEKIDRAYNKLIEKNK